MARAKKDSPAPKVTAKSTRTTRKTTSASTTAVKKEKDVFLEGSQNEDLSAFPCLEMRIFHLGSSHIAQKPSDEVSYTFKSPKEDALLLDSAKLDELAENEDDNDEATYEDQDKTVAVKKSLIDNYRLKSKYYGPLRIVSEKIKVKEHGTSKEAIQAKLQHVEIQATDTDGNKVNEHELRILMSQTPGIIPACDPPSSGQSDNEDSVVLNLGHGEKYLVLKKAMSAFEKLGNVKPPFNTKIQKVFSQDDGKLRPVTLVTLYPRVVKVEFEPTLLNDKKKPVKKFNADKDKDSDKRKLVNCYRQSYINWAHRGNICFSEIKKIGVDFLEEILVANPIVEDSLKLLGCSNSTTAQNLDTVEPSEDAADVLTSQLGSKEFVDDIWNYLTNLVRGDNFLIEFEFEMDEEKWLEIKRAFNMFQVNGEVIPDIVLKVVSKKKKRDYELTYYLRCVGKLIKSGPVLSKTDINDMLKCLAKDKYICVGLSKENFLQQADQNELMRMHLRQNCNLSVFPFEALHDKTCKSIIRDADNFENTKMRRGSVVVYGPSVLCQSCDALHKKLTQLLDPSLTIIAPQEVSQRFIKQRYGPIHTINIGENIKNLFTETPQDYVTNSKRKLAHTELIESEDSVVKQLKAIEDKMEIFPDERPPIKVTESQFEKMLSIKRYSKATNALRKECDVCGYHSKSMLALFLHMNDHLGPLQEECKACNLKLSSKDALLDHGDYCVHTRKNHTCAECHNIFPSNEKMFEHMNAHRFNPPFACSFCVDRLQTLNDYKKHLKLKHGINTVKELKFVCVSCNSYFYTGDHLLIHKVNQKHCENEHFRCKICSFSCNIVSAFHSHLLTHSYNERENNNLAICPECNKLFFSSFKLEDHVKRKHPSTSTKEKEVVMAHTAAQRSTEPAPFAGYNCSKCYKNFGTLPALQRHTEVYHREKEIGATPQISQQHPLSCTACGRKFAMEHMLTSHMKLHTANRPVFQCEECGYVYAKRTQVLEHIRSDHAEQVEKHQQMQQHMIPGTSIYGAQQQPYNAGQVLALESQHRQQQQNQESWNPLKIPAVNPQEVGYNFSNFGSQFY